MQTFIFIFLYTLLSSSSFANDNACDDYLARHYKKDLVPLSLVFENKTHLGIFRYPHQVVTLRIKNQGEVDFNLESTDRDNRRKLQLSIDGIVKEVNMPVPLASGATTNVSAILPYNHLTNCELSQVQIDLDHNVGQWGCQVWNNDTKQLRAMKQGQRFCLVRRFP